MTNLPYRIELLSRLGEYMLSTGDAWMLAKENAFRENRWFIPEFIDLATRQIAQKFLQEDKLKAWISQYDFPHIPSSTNPPAIGIVMAGNIPLVGFHDWLCVFICGFEARIKPSSKDRILITHLLEKISEWSAEAGSLTSFSDMLKGCDGYIATGSNNSSRYFEHYFGKYPHIIRRNRTSVALLTGMETAHELYLLGEDVFNYFGMGCRNVTKIFVPEGYDFVPLLQAFKRFNWMADHNKYKNNYDYNLAIHILNKNYYMTNGSVILIEDKSPFSPISQLNYEFYAPTKDPVSLLQDTGEIQAIVGQGHLPFGSAQHPSLSDYADGVDTLKFLAGFSQN